MCARQAGGPIRLGLAVADGAGRLRRRAADRCRSPGPRCAAPASARRSRPATTARPRPMRLRSAPFAGREEEQVRERAAQRAHGRVGLHRRTGKVERGETDVARGPADEHEGGGGRGACARDPRARNRSSCEAIAQPSRSREVILRWMVPLSVLDLVPVRAGFVQRQMPFRSRWSWRGCASGWDSRATGSPSITAWRASPARCRKS